MIASARVWWSKSRMRSVVAVNASPGAKARALRLNYYALKRRAEPQVPAVSDSLEKNSVATFVELAPPANDSFAAMPAGPCECAVEWEDAAGRKMRIQFKSVPLPDLVALSRSFWNPSP